MGKRRLALVIAGGIAVAGGLFAPPARAEVKVGRDPLVIVRTNDNEVLLSCTAVGPSGFYSTVTLFGTTILVKPGGSCPVPPDIQ